MLYLHTDYNNTVFVVSDSLSTIVMIVFDRISSYLPQTFFSLNSLDKLVGQKSLTTILLNKFTLKLSFWGRNIILAEIAYFPHHYYRLQVYGHLSPLDFPAQLVVLH